MYHKNMGRSGSCRFRPGQKSGFTLVGMIVLIIGISLAVVAGWSSLDSLSSGNVCRFEEEQALYIAQAGLNAAIMRIEASLRANPDWRNPQGDYNPGATLTGNIADGSFTVAFEDTGKHQVTVRSRGTYAGYDRTLTHGLRRIAAGANYSIYCGGPGGLSLYNALWSCGNAYISGPHWSQGAALSR